MVRPSIALFSCAFLSGVFADDYVLVTAEKLDSSNWGNAHATTVINAKDQGVSVLTDVLNFIPGVYATGSGNAGSGSAIYMRGSESSQTLLLIDGIEVNDPSISNRATAPSNFSLGGMERVEVVRGGQSLHYGSTAIGGVINIISTPEKTGKTFSAGYGNAHEHLLRFKQSSQIGKWNYHYMLEKKGDEGISSARDKTKAKNDKDGFNLVTFHAGAKGEISDTQRLEFAFRHQNKRQEFDGGVALDDASQESVSKDTYGRVAHTYFAQGIPLEVVSSFSFADHKREYYSTSPKYEYKGGLMKLALQGNYFWDKKNATSLALEEKREEDRSKSSELAKKKNDISSIWLNHHFEMERFFISLGGRYEDDELAPSRSTYRVAPGIRLPWYELILKGAVSTAYRSPTLFELGDKGWGTGNPNLKAERSTQREVGLAHKYASLTYFQMRIKDRLSYDFTTLKNVNAGKAEINGVEAEAHTERMKGFALQFSGTRLYTKDLATHKELRRRPRFMSSLGLDHEYDVWKTGLTFLYVGARDDVSKRMPSYYTTNLSLTWKKKDLEVWGKLSNLLDLDYQEIDGYNTPGRQLMAGLDWNF